MSQEQAVRRAMLRQAGLVWDQAFAEVQALATRDLGLRELFAAFLQIVARPLHPAAAAVWLQTTIGQLELTAERNLASVLSLAEPEAQTEHARLLERALASGAGLVAAPGEQVGGDGPEVVNPTDRVVVIAPLKTHQRAVGVVEFFHVPDKPGPVLGGYLDFLVQASALLRDYLTRQSLRNLEERQAALVHVEQFARLAHRSLSRRQTAYTLANEGRRMLQCDRLSVAVVERGRSRLEAISGQDVFDRRSSVVRRMQDLAAIAARSGEPIWFPRERDHLPPQLEDAINDFLDVSQSRLVIVLPLACPQPEGERRVKPQPTVGALVVEQFREPELPLGCEGRLELVRQMSAQALTNALEHESFFLAPVLKSLSQLWLLRSNPWTKVSAACVIALALALVFVPASLQLEGRGTLEPVGRHDVFAAVDGVVEQVLVEHGDVVQPGQVVARLRNTDVDVKLTDLQGELLSTSAALRRVNTTLLSGKPTGTDRERMHGERSQLLARQGSLKDQITLYERKLRGWVGTPLEEANLGCHLDTKTLLCQVGDPQQLEAALVIDQSDVEYVHVGDVVELKLDQLPGDTLQGTISSLSQIELRVTPPGLSVKSGGDVATQTDESGVERPQSTSYQAQVLIDDQESLLRLGLRGRAKVHAERRTLAQRAWRYFSHTFRFGP